MENIKTDSNNDDTPEKNKGEKEIIKADIATKKKFTFIICGLCFVGIIFLIMINYFTERVQSGLDSEDIAYYLMIFKAVVILLFIGFLFYVYVLAKKGVMVINSEQFPAPGEKVLRDTALLKGGEAVKKGYLLIAFSVFIFLFSILFTWACWGFTKVVV